MKFRKVVAATLLAAMALTACGGNNSSDKTNATTSPTEATSDTTDATENSNEVTQTSESNSPAPGDMGEPYVTYMTQDCGTLNYLVTNKSVDAEDGYVHFEENLLETDKFARLKPSLAESYTVSYNAEVFTFKIRSDVKWATWDQKEYGENVTAHDFVTSAKYVLDPYHASLNAWFITDFVAGAQEYYDSLLALLDEYGDDVEGYKAARDSVDFSTVGVKALDDMTLEYTMINPTPYFPSITTYGVYCPVNEKFLNEIGEDDFGTKGKESILYNGSFTMTDWTLEVEKIFKKNELYWQKDRVHIPYIRYFFVADEVVPLELYKRGDISAAAITTLYLEEMLADPTYSNQLYITSTSSQSWCWAFNVRETSGEYANPDFRTAALNENFRKAVFHAFNRRPYLKIYNPEEEAVDKMLSGAFMPVGLCVTEEGKDYTEFGNLPEVIEANRNNYDPDKAKEALDAAKAELGDSVTWPIKIRILGTSNEVSKAQSAVTKQVLEEGLGTDNVIIETVIYTGDTYYTTVDNGAFDMWQFGWSADYSDPNNYLGTLLKDNDMNDYGFEFFPSYTEYEAAYNDANTTYDIDERYEKFAKAEQIMYDNYVIIPFRYVGGNYAINKVQNPYDSLSRGMYGNSPDRFLDVIYGTEPITSEEREAQRVAYEAEKEAIKGK